MSAKLPPPEWPLYRLEETAGLFGDDSLLVSIRTAVGPHRKEYLVTYAISRDQLQMAWSTFDLVDEVYEYLLGKLTRNIEEGERS